jgi:hypothetical protein
MDKRKLKPIRQRGTPDRRGMGAEGDAISELFVPDENYKAHQQSVTRTLAAAGLSSKEIASMLPVPIEPPHQAEPAEGKSKKPRSYFLVANFRFPGNFCEIKKRETSHNSLQSAPVPDHHSHS